MKLRDGDTVADMNVLAGSVASDSKRSEEEFVFALTSQGFGKRVSTSEFRTQARGGVGVITIKFKKGQDDTMKCLLAVNKDDEILVITAKGIMVRQKVSLIPSQGRAATGVLVQRLDEGDHISSVSVVPQFEETDE